MTGVEILAMEEVAVAFGFNWLAFWVITGLLTFAGFVLGLVIAEKYAYDWQLVTALVLVGIIGGLLIGGPIGFASSEPTAYETQYKVTVSDEVPMNEFLERYEIIDQEGKVYIVRERNDYVEPEIEGSTEKTGYWTGWENSECSECGQFNVMVYSGKHLNYCPNCGIKMEPKESVNNNEKIK